MIEELGERLLTFHGEQGHMHCFLHIVNLMAKLLIQQFDMSKKAADIELNVKNDATQQLKAMAEETDEPSGTKGIDLKDEEEDEIEVENNEGWIDELGALSEAEYKQLIAVILLVKLALVKVHVRELVHSLWC